MKITRRTLLASSAALIAAGSALTWLYNRPRIVGSLGDLLIDPKGILDLPSGFSYQILERTGALMSDGYPMPDLPDGMGCFPGSKGQWIVVRNHEIHQGQAADHTLAYDPQRGGGVSRVVVDAKSGQRLSSNLLLTGTSRNCAGGPCTEGWLSCEEIDEPDHGYVFLCDPAADTLQPARRLPSLGRFPHEAAAFDPASGITYLTEDTADSAIYRHVPERSDQPFSAGTLQALKLVDTDRADLSAEQQVGDRLTVDWGTIDDPQAQSIPTRHQAHARGAAVLSRGEGMWSSPGVVYLASTDGGPARRGQIYRLDIAPPGEQDRLSLVAQAENDNAMANPDNLTIAPGGDVYIAEDGSEPNLIWQLRSNGDIFPIARNALSGEVTGLCFSPDGNWLFANLQKEGLTLAIRGPFNDRTPG